METFDDISCEEYSQIYDDQQEFQAWVREVEQAARLREVCAEVALREALGDEK